MVTLSLRFFGGVRAEIVTGSRVESARVEPKRLALLAYLAADVAGHLHTRDSLISIFWPERPEHLARLALRQSLHHLAARLGPDILLREGRQLVGLATDRISCDVHRFQRALGEGRPRDALEEYRGGFLEGFVLSTQPRPFDEWIQRTRTRFRDAAIAATAAVAAEEGVASASAHPALGYVHRALALSPYSEDLLNQAVDLRLRSGDRGGAIDEIREFSQRLRSELGIAPSVRVERLRTRAASGNEVATRGFPVRLPEDGLRQELEAVLAGSVDRAERQVESVGPDGRAIPCRLVLEPMIHLGIVHGLTVRFALAEGDSGR